MSGARRRWSAAIASTLAAAFIAASPAVASADPSIWARARQPGVAARADALAQAEALVHKYRRLQKPALGGAFREMGEIILRDAKQILETAGAATTTDALMRYRYAEILSDLGEYEASAKHYEVALRSPSLAAPLRASGLTELAICYARQRRHADEIKIYTDALALEPIGPLRAMILANRAEAYMVLGDITKAIEGYRGALGSLLPIEMFNFGVTTLWGLGVALDRSGDLESALGSIHLARQYDRADQLINGPGWFYVPEYDSEWYAALGFWERARDASLSMARAEAYQRAISAWESYIDRAPDTDRWVPLAKARLRACEAERAVAVPKGAKSKRDPRDVGSGLLVVPPMPAPWAKP